MELSNITIIGAGNMGRCLAGGLIQNNHPADHIIISDPSQEKCITIKNEFCIEAIIDNKKAIEKADVVIFAVKPTVLIPVIQSLRILLIEKNPLILSVAAGMPLFRMAECLKTDARLIRIMPNTPALIGYGASALYANPSVSQQDRDLAEKIMQSVGIVAWLHDEALMDTVTALSGSGPAYFFLLMEVMQNAAIELGLDKETAKLLTLQTALGAARMAIESDSSLADLRKKVTSPGGTTEKALSVLEDNQIDVILKKALLAAKQRSKELGEK
jgi:pyrroline-5-carboxylate reductase